MSQVSAKLRKSDSNQGYTHYCPGCENAHVFACRSDGIRPSWSFDGNVNAPTFNPSMLIRWGKFVPGYEEKFKDHEHGGICHYFLHNGKIQFLSDSTHKLAGQTIPLPDLPDYMQGDKWGDG